jgi:mRNA interferase MazF
MTSGPDETPLGQSVRRGEVWTVAVGTPYSAKPRPAVIVQDDRFDATRSITICSFTTNETDAPLYRPLIEPNQGNGLRLSSRIMVDKIVSVPRARLGNQIGRLDAADLSRLNRALVVFLGLGAPSRARPG